MEVTLLHFLIVCPLVCLAGFVDAIAGGGGLISLPAYFIAGLPAHNAIATNKLSSCMGTTLATWRYAKSGYVPWKIASFCVLCAFIGSASGAKLALMIDDRVFKTIMLAVLPLTAFYVLRGKALDDSAKVPRSNLQTTLIGMAAALVIGVYDGFYGPGTGTFLLLLLTSVARMKLSSANGVAKVVNLATNAAALAVFLTSGKVVMALGLVAGAFSVLGNYLGTRRFDRGGARAVKPVMIAVLTIFFATVLFELVRRS